MRADLTRYHMEPDAAVREKLDHIANDVARRFEGIFSLETVTRCLRESYRALAATAITTTYLPVLTERFVRERLDALAQAEGANVSTVPEILYVCVHNAGRSIAAAVLTDHYAHGRVHVRSAGSQTGSEVNRGRWPTSCASADSIPTNSSPSPLPTKLRTPPTSSSRWDAVTPARFSRQALPRLGTHRPRGQDRRRGPADHRSHRRTRAPTPRRTSRRSGRVNEDTGREDAPTRQIQQRCRVVAAVERRGRTLA